MTGGSAAAAVTEWTGTVSETTTGHTPDAGPASSTGASAAITT